MSFAGFKHSKLSGIPVGGLVGPNEEVRNFKKEHDGRVEEYTVLILTLLATLDLKHENKQ